VGGETAEEKEKKRQRKKDKSMKFSKPLKKHHIF